MFSVIIPLYNKELSIQNTINSVLSQTFQDFEIIVVNDGSSDSSAELVKQFNNNKIRLINKKNGGVSSARNLGITYAKYQWISFLDGDDLWEKNHLEIINKMILKFPSDKLFATSFKYSDNRIINRKLTSDSIYKINNYFKASLEEHLIWTSIFTCHIDCLKRIKFDENLAIGEDLYLFSKLVKLNDLVKSTEVTATYRIDAENRSNLGKYKMNKSFLSILAFDEMDSIEEKKYFRKLIIQKLKHFIVKKDINNVIFILKRYGIKLLN